MKPVNHKNLIRVAIGIWLPDDVVACDDVMVSFFLGFWFVANVLDLLPRSLSHNTTTHRQSLESLTYNGRQSERSREGGG